LPKPSSWPKNWVPECCIRVHDRKKMHQSVAAGTGPARINGQPNFDKALDTWRSSRYSIFGIRLAL
jgi:hypothetical protein